MSCALSSISKKVAKGDSSVATSRLVNLFLYARTTIMSDELQLLLHLIGENVPGTNDQETIREVNDCIKSLCYLSDLVDSNVLSFYYPSGRWASIYDSMQNELIMETGLDALDSFYEWVKEDIVTDYDLEEHWVGRYIGT